MGVKNKGKIEESKLLKAISELHDEMEKGDALEGQDPEGGLATEGSPLSDAAPKGRGETKKSKARSASSSSAASSMEKADDDDDSSSDDGSTKKSADAGSRKIEKAKAPPFGGSSSSSASSDGDDDDDSGDDESSSSEKSFREQAENDEVLSKAIDATPIIEALVDNFSAAMGRLQRNFMKALQEVESRLGARIDSRVSKGIALQGGFNTRLAKAITAIGETVEENVDMVKSLANAPAAPRGKAILSKAEVNQPPWSGGGGGSMADGSGNGDDVLMQLKELPPDKVGDWLFKKSATNQLDSQLIMAWEADRYNVEALPEPVRKALASDLLK